MAEVCIMKMENEANQDSSRTPLEVSQDNSYRPNDQAILYQETDNTKTEITQENLDQANDQHVNENGEATGHPNIDATQGQATIQGETIQVEKITNPNGEGTGHLKGDATQGQANTHGGITEVKQITNANGEATVHRNGDATQGQATTQGKTTEVSKTTNVNGEATGHPETEITQGNLDQANDQHINENVEATGHPNGDATQGQANTHGGTTEVKQTTNPNGEATGHPNGDAKHHQATTQGGITEAKQITKENRTRPKLLQKSVSISKIIQEYEFSSSFDSQNFDELFAYSERPYRPKLGETKTYKDSIDEGISSSMDIDSPDDEVEFRFPEKVVPPKDEVEIRFPEKDPPGLGPRQESFASRLSRVDSVMEQSFKQMLLTSCEKSQGYMGFRRRVANDINHKYFSLCRCDDILFVFLHLLFGMICICAGVYGVMECQNLEIVNYFMFLEGLLSVFVFPILLMNWTKHVGGCVHEDQKVGRGFSFLAVLILRIVTVILGTVLLVLHMDWLGVDRLWCQITINTFLAAVIVGWTLIICVIIMPLLWYGVVYLISRRVLLYKTQYTDSDNP